MPANVSGDYPGQEPDDDKEPARLKNPNFKMLQIKFQNARRGQLPAGGRSAAVNRILRKLRGEGAPKPQPSDDDAEDLDIFKKL